MWGEEPGGGNLLLLPLPLLGGGIADASSPLLALFPVVALAQCQNGPGGFLLGRSSSRPCSGWIRSSPILPLSRPAGDALLPVGHGLGDGTAESGGAVGARGTGIPVLP